MSHDSLVEAYRAANGPQAHMVANFLQEAGIRAFIDGEESGAGAAGLPVGGMMSPRILVPEGDLDRARELIATVEANDDAPLFDDDDDDLEDSSFPDEN